MRILGDKENIREEIQGKTGLIPEYEEQLFQDIADLEKEADTIPGMSKADWISMVVMTAAAVIMTAICIYWAV